jgi:hypothetical protein
MLLFFSGCGSETSASEPLCWTKNRMWLSKALIIENRAERKKPTGAKEQTRQGSDQ